MAITDPTIDALFTAVKLGDLATVKSLIAQKINVNTRDAEQRTPLMYAAFLKGEDTSILTALINAKADVNAAERNGLTPLMIAAMHDGNQPAVPLLLAAGADPNKTSTIGQTALMFAVTGKGVPKQRVLDLLDAGADPNAKITEKGDPREGLTALAYAMQHHKGEIVALLTDRVQEPANGAQLASNKLGLAVRVATTVTEKRER